MALGLHPYARAAIVSALEAGIPHIVVNNGMFIERFTAFLATYAANEALPSTGKLREQIVDYIDDLPLVDFATDFLERQLSDRGGYEQEPATRKLVEIEGFTDVPSVANQIVDAFDSLPWRYVLTVPLPLDLLPQAVFEDGPLALGQHGRITNPDLIMNQEFPITHENPNVQKRGNSAGLLGLLIPETEWKNDFYYLQEECEGFIGIYGDTNTMERTERKLESFLGLGLATRLFSYIQRYENPEIKLRWTLHQRVGEQWELASKIAVNDDTLAVIRHLKSFAFSNDYPADSRNSWLLKVLKNSNEVFRSEKSKTLLLSSKWFFDSFKGTDVTLKYIRMMTRLRR